ncbi:hypothetical protein W97_02300 [Coniosporium apollinis CBS 100218]|uniref:NAD(P)-binding protein n=1 Tax=Coniosporium apollinis (strain CBS 100218) TaxID=1168221 RepID=R7YMI0_CONA1|nr:uncharacterized protein W97_02300 [Coniosporium apollinis CBS 100218]EON63073.1 hypothetical protein W97_02300 [Coniosporium apollinis CBS 100218]
MESNQFDLSLGLNGTHVVVTGGAGLIGSVVVKAFIAAGSSVSSLDIRHDKVTRVSEQLLEIEADISSTESMQRAWADAEHSFGPVICCVALASLDLSVLQHHDSAADMSLEQFKRTMDVNVGGTFLAAKLWLQGLREQRATRGRAEEDRKKNRPHEENPWRNVGLIMVGSESGWFGERSNADYAASKSAVQVGLLQSLKSDVPRVWPGARVNAIAPGPVDTARFKEECKQDPNQYYLDAQATTALCKPVPVEAVARSIVFLASEKWSGNVHGQVLNVDSGKQGKLMWSRDECSA